MTTTLADVRAISEEAKAKVDADLQPFLTSAILIVSEQLLCTMSAARKDLITAYVAAHLLSISGTAGGGNVRMSRIGEAQEQYFSAAQSIGGYGTTMYGVTAMMLDPCGVLAKSTTSSKPPAQFRVV